MSVIAVKLIYGMGLIEKEMLILKKYICILLSLMLFIVMSPAVFASSPKYLPFNYVEGFHDGLAVFGIYEKNDIKMGYINTSGKIVIPARSGQYGAFSDGLAVFTKDPIFGKYGYIDKTGKEVIKPLYENPHDFSEGLAAVRTEVLGKWGYIDKKGKEITQLKYEDAKDFSEGLAAIRLGDKWGFIDKTGQEVIKPQYENVYDFSEGLASVELDGKWGYIDKTGQVVIEFKFDNAVLSFSDGLAISISKASKYGFIDKAGNEVLTPQYDYMLNFSEGLAAFVVKDKWGFVDKSGKVVIQPQYHEVISSFNEGLAIVSKVASNGKILEGFIDETGKEVIGFTSPFFTAKPFSGGYTVLSDGGEGKGYIVANPVPKKDANSVPQKDTNIKDSSISAQPTTSKVLVNGKDTAFQAYNINNNNYFKLRDIAMVLNNTEKSFSVGWDGAKNAISLETGKPYEAVGGELMVLDSPTSEKGNLSSSVIYLNAKSITLKAYTIKGNNYFKLRDLAAALDFGVTWDASSNSIVIDTSSGYVPEG
ncbi:WG repeat-containing protein [Paenibacillus sp. EPM92]|uniref:WG repeat-containing protein n=1 Tax=Paenibacillus sp. EPM92 TaxID=1561195 RepID=UPI0019159900|nr:WG repeat-containing protein [Paenibacillus sp. EPM92]